MGAVTLGVPSPKEEMAKPLGGHTGVPGWKGWPWVLFVLLWVNHPDHGAGTNPAMGPGGPAGTAAPVALLAWPPQ